MPDAYTVYWPRERWQQSVDVPGDLPVLFGGPHQSFPSFTRAKVGPGDVLDPIGYRNQALWLFGRVRVTAIDQVEPGDSFLDGYANWAFLVGSCVDEVVRCTDSVRVPQGRAVPGEVLARMAYQPRRGGPRPVKFVTEDGRLTRSDSVQGIYRLTTESAADVDAILSL